MILNEIMLQLSLQLSHTFMCSAMAVFVIMERKCSGTLVAKRRENTPIHEQFASRRQLTFYNYECSAKKVESTQLM